MRKGTLTQRQGKAYIIVAIVLIILVPVSSIVLYRYITYDPYMGVKPDIVRIKDYSRPAKGKGTSIRLGSTEFVAGLSLFFCTDEDDKDWDFCSIKVCRERGDTYHVFFERQLVLASFLKKSSKRQEIDYHFVKQE